MIVASVCPTEGIGLGLHFAQQINAKLC